MAPAKDQKKTSTGTLARNQDKVPAVAPKAPKSAKENMPSQVQSRSTSAAKLTKSSTQAAKSVSGRRSPPSQISKTRTPLHDVDMDEAELATLRATVAKQRGWFYICLLALLDHFLSAEINMLKKTVEKPSKEIPRPKKISNLQEAMELTSDKKMYTYCRVSFSAIVQLQSKYFNRQLFEMWWLVRL